jgi:hypothetical protein
MKDGIFYPYSFMALNFPSLSPSIPFGSSLLSLSFLEACSIDEKLNLEKPRKLFALV